MVVFHAAQIHDRSYANVYIPAGPLLLIDHSRPILIGPFTYNPCCSHHPSPIVSRPFYPVLPGPIGFRPEPGLERCTSIPAESSRIFPFPAHFIDRSLDTPAAVLGLGR